LLLTIAQKENDTPKLREIAFRFISYGFDADYYAIYKSAFSPEEWEDEVERLISHYAEQQRSYDDGLWNSFIGFFAQDCVADVLVAEQMTGRLLEYVSANLTVKRIERYHPHLQSRFPEETLSLFRRATDLHAEKTGEKNYETLVAALRRMRTIPNGGAVVDEMIAQYRILYKRRRVMLQMLADV
jgi:hypothetical protein